MKVHPGLIPRAAVVRLRTLDLGGLNDYYLVSSAESSSTLVASAPETTNAYVLAYGAQEGLAPGERLEAYGSAVRLVRTMAYGCPRGVSAASLEHGAIAAADLAAITRELDQVWAIYAEFDSHSGGTPPMAGKGSPVEERMWEVVYKAGQAGQPSCTGGGGGGVTPPVDSNGVTTTTTTASASEPSAKELRAMEEKLRRSNREVVVAEWRRRAAPPPLIKPTNGETDGDLLVENGVCFSTPEQAGLRALRAARLAFMSMIERTANGVREAQQHRVSDEQRPIAVLDVSGIDFSFSHAAVQSTVELSLHESQCRLNFIPLNRAAAMRVEGSMASYVRQVVAAPGVPHADPFALLRHNYFDVGAYTCHLDLPASATTTSDGGGGRRSTSRATFDASLQLARALGMMRKGSPMLVSFVPTPRSTAAIHAEVSQGRRPEVAMEATTVAEAKACIAAAISRSGRWGYIMDEVLPMVDCPQGSAISLVVTVL